VNLKLPRVGEIVAGAGGAGLLASLFLPWYGTDAAGCPAPPASCPTSEATGFEAFGVLDVVLVAAAVAAIALLLLEATQPTAAIPVAWSAITALLGLVAVPWALYRTLDPPAGAEHLDTRFAYLGLIASVGIAAGAWMSMRDEGFGLRPGPGIEPTLDRGAASPSPDPLPVPRPSGPPEGQSR
jgi:hypothetical protein